MPDPTRDAIQAAGDKMDQAFREKALKEPVAALNAPTQEEIQAAISYK